VVVAGIQVTLRLENAGSILRLAIRFPSFIGE